jgi:Outer membrane protein beta-barrel domain
MKKSIGVLCVALLLTGSQLFAQSFQLGIKGGGNLSTFLGSTNSSYGSYSTQAGWNAGVFVNFWLGNHFGIAPEVLYTEEGARVKLTTSENNNNVYINSQLNLRYLSFPVMAKYRFTGGFFIEAGPEININVSNSNWDNQSVKNITNNAELAAGLGIGYQSPIGLGIGLRYNVGLTTVDNTSNANWNDVNLRNSSFNLDLFWTIFNNKKLSQNQ